MRAISGFVDLGPRTPGPRLGQGSEGHESVRMYVLPMEYIINYTNQLKWDIISKFI